MHTIHGDIHEIGLQDNCGDCWSHAEKPCANLDTKMLSNLVVMTLMMRMYPDQAEYPRSENEAIARASVMNILEQMGRIFEVMQEINNVDLVKDYFHSCWCVEI